MQRQRQQRPARQAAKSQNRKINTAARKPAVAQRTARRATAQKAARRNIRVAVVGAAGGIGQPLSLLLKTNYTGLISSLSLFDVAPVTPGVGADLSHIPTSVKVDAFAGNENLEKALAGANIVVVPAGVPRKPGMTRDDLFNTNASINQNLAKAFAKACPDALALIISNPVNSTVPIWAETLQEAGVYNPQKLMGVTALDVFRANTFASEIHQDAVHVPVIGGHAGKTIVPLFSLASVSLPQITENQEALDAITNRVMFGGDEVVKAKGGAGSATLSMASAGARFVESCLLGLAGRPVTEIAYVENAAANEKFGTRFFSSEIKLTKDGAAEVLPTWERASPYEQKLVEEMVPDLQKQIAKGIEFAANNKQ